MLFVTAMLFCSRAEGGAKMCGLFHVKNHDFTPKYHIFSNFWGRAPGAPPPGSVPVMVSVLASNAVDR